MAAYQRYIELVEHFEQLTDCVEGLKSVVVGSDEESLESQSSRIIYPHLRVDTPEIRFLNDDDSPFTRYRFQFFVMTNEPRKTNKDENIKLSEMETLCSRIIRQLYADADDGCFDLITGDKEGDAIRKWSGDNDFGWWFYVTIDLFTDECC